MRAVPSREVPGFRLAAEAAVLGAGVVEFHRKRYGYQLGKRGEGGALEGGTAYAIKNELPNLRKLCRL
jgi:hypothetical protein